MIIYAASNVFAPLGISEELLNQLAGGEPVAVKLGGIDQPELQLQEGEKNKTLPVGEWVAAPRSLRPPRSLRSRGTREEEKREGLPDKKETAEKDFSPAIRKAMTERVGF